MRRHAGERRTRAAGLGLQRAQIDALRGHAGVEGEPHRTRRAGVGELAGQLGLHLDAGAGRRTARECQRPAQLHGRGSGVEQRRLQRVQRCGQVPAFGRPAALAAQAAGAGLSGAQVRIECAQRQLARPVGAAGQFERQAAQRQPALVPAAGERVGCDDHDLSGSIGRGARRVGL